MPRTYSFIIRSLAVIVAIYTTLYCIYFIDKSPYTIKYHSKVEYVNEGGHLVCVGYYTTSKDSMLHGKVLDKLDKKTVKIGEVVTINDSWDRILSSVIIGFIATFFLLLITAFDEDEIEEE